MKLLIFTYAPAGLGHLRVTDALVDCRLKKYPYIMLGSYDRFITGIHRFTSTNPIARHIFTASQYGWFEDLVTFAYRSILVMTSKQIYLRLKDIIANRVDVDEVWVVATHFGMAHQIGAVKQRLMKETGKTIRLMVQVTDATSQHIWCIRGADLTFVPSLKTKNDLQAYARRNKMDLLFEVIPYPLCPGLTKRVEETDFRFKDFFSIDSQINVAVPISGAAVGLSFVAKLISAVVRKSKRFKFWVLVKKSVYTNFFVKSLSKLPNVNLITGRNDNEMISLYELLYEQNLVHLEITKPSEQAFKAILPPTLVGGSIILFTAPVGRQESENIDFLVRHNLLLVKSDNDEMFLADNPSDIFRTINLPRNPEKAASFIVWALENGLFTKLCSPGFSFSKSSLSSGEVGPGGAYEFWKITERHFG